MGIGSVNYDIPRSDWTDFENKREEIIQTHLRRKRMIEVLPYHIETGIGIPSNIRVITAKNPKFLKKKNLKIIFKHIIPYKDHILGLKNGWGGTKDNKKFKKQTWKRTVKFLKILSSELPINFHNLSNPKILPVSDSSIDLIWRHKKFNLFVNIPEDLKEHIEFRGEVFKANKPEIDGHDYLEVITGVLSTWLRKIL